MRAIGFVQSFLKFLAILLGGLLLSPLAGCVREQRPEHIGELERRVARLEREVREFQSARNTTTDASNAKGSGASSGLQALKEKRRQLLRVYTERHPAVKLLNKEIFDLEYRSFQP